jgi:hypothetical protein
VELQVRVTVAVLALVEAAPGVMADVQLIQSHTHRQRPQGDQAVKLLDIVMLADRWSFIGSAPLLARAYYH